MPPNELNPAETPKLTNRELIYQAITDLAATNRAASRQVISSMTGIKMTIVDDHIKRMKDDGKLRMVVNGVFEPVEEHREDRPVSMTFYKSGCKLEIGEICIELSMREARNIGMASVGVTMQFGR